MKKLFSLIAAAFLFTVSSFSQTPAGWETSVPQGCFCCSNNIYNLPKTPVISGPDSVCACNNADFSVPACPGAEFQWTVTGNAGDITFTGQRKNAITIQSPYPPNTTQITIKVQIRCGDKTVTATKVLLVKSANPAFPYTITSNGNGTYTITTSYTGSTASYWRFTEITQNSSGKPDNNVPCTAWGYGQVLHPAGGSSTSVAPGMNFSWTGALDPNKTYRIIHWVDKCSSKWSGTCVAVKWVCFKIQPSALKTAPKTRITPIETGESNLIVAPSAEMLKFNTRKMD